jgi:hypothetical protein
MDLFGFAIMLKRLLIVIFVLQSVAFNAMAGTNMSQLNQAEITQMQLMHQASNEENHCASSIENASNKTTSSIDYCSCDTDANCHNLVCSSIHSNSPIDTKLPHTFTSSLLLSNTVTALIIQIPLTYYQPETPPPSV